MRCSSSVLRMCTTRASAGFTRRTVFTASCTASRSVFMIIGMAALSRKVEVMQLA